MRVLVAIATAAVLLLGVAAPHHHGTAGDSHECVACAVGGALEARDATPALRPPQQLESRPQPEVAPLPVAGFPLGAVPGQSPPLA